MSHWLPSPSTYTYTHQLLKEKGEEQGEKGNIFGREKGRDSEGQRERQINEIACALERNRGQVTASAQLCTAH